MSEDSVISATWRLRNRLKINISFLLVNHLRCSTSKQPINDHNLPDTQNLYFWPKPPLKWIRNSPVTLTKKLWAQYCRAYSKNTLLGKIVRDKYDYFHKALWSDPPGSELSVRPICFWCKRNSRQWVKSAEKWNDSKGNYPTCGIFHKTVKWLWIKGWSDYWLFSQQIMMNTFHRFT